MNGARPTVARSDLLLLLAVGIVIATIAVAVLAGRTSTLDERARGIESQLRCPTCQGLSIADSPATSATQMRSLVREQLAGGASDAEVTAFFVARYGRWILLDPPPSGPDLALWLAPAVILGLGGLVVVRRARRHVPVRARGAWAASAPLPVPRLGTIVIGAGMILAVAVPIAAAVGPRLAGREVSGGNVAQPPASIQELEDLVRAQPRDAQALVALGDALLAANRPGEAADRYKAALEVDSANIGALLGVGTILLAADRPDGAIAAFDRILAISPDEPDALLYRAVARIRLAGPTSDARRDIERFLVVADAADPRRAMATGLLAPSPSPSAPSAAPSNASPSP